MLNPRPMGKNELADFLASGEPTTAEYFKANIQDGFDNTTIGVALDYVKETISGAPEERASESQAKENISAFYEKRKPNIVDESSPQLKNFTLEDWKKSEHFRDGVDFKDGWSEDRARYLAEGYDEKRERELTLSKGDTGYGRKGLGFVGQMVGGLPDPINLIPFGGATSKGARVGEKIIRAGVEGAVGNLAVSAVTRPYWDKRGTDSDWTDYVNDIWIGGAMGGGFGALGHAFSKADVPLKDHSKLAEAGDLAINAIAKGEDLDLAKVDGLQESFDSVFDIPEVQRSRKVQDMTDQLTKIGYSPEDAKTHISPIIAQAEAFARDFGISVDEFLEAHGPTFQKAELSNGQILKVTPESTRMKVLLESELQSMSQEISFAQKGEKIFEDGSFVGSQASTFPEWYREAGVKNKEHLAKVMESKSGPVYERLLAIAEDRLINGYETPTSRSAPSNEFLSLVGREQAEIPVGPDGEPLFQSKFRRDAGLQPEQATIPFPDDFKKVEVKTDTSISYKFNKTDLANELRHAFDFKIKNEHTGKNIEVNQETLGKVTSFILNDARYEAPQVRRDYIEVAKNLKQIIKDSVFHEKAADEKGKNRGEFRYMVSEVEVDGRRYLAQLQVNSDGKSAKLYNFKLVDMEDFKKEGRATAASLDETGKGAIPPSSDTISAFREKINHARKKADYFKGNKGSERGAISFDQDGKSIIHLFENADESTIIHETGHLFLNNLEKFSAMENASPKLKADFQNIKKWMGVPEGGKIEVKHHEKFARGFEQYLREGKAPRPELHNVFSRFKDWLTSIYKSSDQLKVKLSDDARAVYARLLGAESRPRVDSKIEIKAPEPLFKDEAEIDAKASEIQTMVDTTPGIASPEEVAMFSESIQSIETEERALDEVLNFFQSAKDDAALLASANKVGMSKSQFERIIDEFNSKLMSEDEARLGLEKLIEQRKISLAAEAKEMKRQAFLALSARTQVASHISKVIEAGGTARESVLSILEGVSSLRGVEGAGNSVDGSYMALAQSTSSKCFSELRKVDPRIEKLFENDIQFNQNVVKEMITPGSSGDAIAQKSAEILSRFEEELRQRQNLAGAKIGKLEGHVPRTHDVEKMIGKESEWVNFMAENLDRDRSFVGLEDAEFRDSLRETFRSLITGEHGHGPEIDTAVPMQRPPRNIAKKLGESRSLHFKSAEVEVAYLKQFGQGENILQSMAMNFERSSRNIALMERLGPNPEATISYMIDKLRKDIDSKAIFKDLDDAKVVEMLQDLGTVNDLKTRDSDIGHAMMQALGETSSQQGWFKNASQIFRAVNSLSKLGSALLSQPTDFVHALNERRILSNKNEAQLWIEVFKDYFDTPSPEMKEVLDHVGIFVDAINYKNFNRFDGDNINNKLGRANDFMFRWSGQNWHVRHSKNAAGMSLAREMGSNISKAWNDIHPGLRETLAQYGSFNEKKWEMLRKTEAVNIDGKAYYHPGMIEKIPDSEFIDQIPAEFRERPQDFLEGDNTPEVKSWEEKRANEIKRARFKLEMDLKTFFVEESRNAAPEPDAKVRRVMAFGTKGGTKTNEAIKLLTQFKTFAFVNWDRSIKGKRMMRDANDYGGLVHHAVATLALGYLSTVLKDTAKGLVPADPSEGKTWMRAAFQSGGLGIMGDFVQAGVSSRSGADALTSLAGPTASTVGNFINLAGKSVRGDALEDGDKLASKWIDFGRSMAPAPFSSLWYTRAAMDHLVWQNLKETLEPGSIRRSQKRLKKEYNQKYIVSPQSTQWLPQL